MSCSPCWLYNDDVMCLHFSHFNLNWMIWKQFDTKRFLLLKYIFSEAAYSSGHCRRPWTGFVLRRSWQCSPVSGLWSAEWSISIKPLDVPSRVSPVSCVPRPSRCTLNETKKRAFCPPINNLVSLLTQQKYLLAPKLCGAIESRMLV